MLDTYSAIPDEIKDVFASLARSGERVQASSNSGTRDAEGAFSSQDLFPFTIHADSLTKRFQVTNLAQRQLADLVGVHNNMVAKNLTYEGDTLYTACGIDWDGLRNVSHIVAKDEQGAIDHANRSGMTNIVAMFKGRLEPLA